MQDAQYLFERPALADLVANLEPAGAERWIEFGWGTGRFVEELFVRYLPPNACYYIHSLVNVGSPPFVPACCSITPDFLADSRLPVHFAALLERPRPDHCRNVDPNRHGQTDGQAGNSRSVTFQKALTRRHGVLGPAYRI